MSEFEFLRSMPFGPYLPVDSPLHRLDPRARILMTLALVGVLTVAPRPLGLAFGLAVILIGYRLARAPIGPLLRGWWSALPFLLILAVLQVLLRGGPDENILFQWGWLRISSADLLVGLTLLLRFSALMAVLGLAAASLSESEVTHGLDSLLKPLANIGVPVQDFVMMVQVTMRFFPLLAQIAERIAKAQASRGADWTPAGWNPIRRARQVAPLIVPLFVTSLRRAENMALAMDARGYGSGPIRTSMIVLNFRWVDWLALVVTVGAAALVIIL